MSLINPTSRTAAAGALAALAVAATPASADQTHVADWQVTDVSAYGETVIVTRKTASRSYELAQIRDGQAVRLNVPTSREPYVTDVGSDDTGRRLVVYSRPDRGGDDDMYVYSLETGIERKLAGSRRGTDERRPSIHGGEIVFARSGAGAKRDGVYRRVPIGPDRNKDQLIWRTARVKATDIEDRWVTFESDVKVGNRRSNGIYVVREGSRRPQLVAVTATRADGSRTAVSSPSLSGGYLHYVRYDSNREAKNSFARYLVAGTAVQSQRVERPADARSLAVSGTRLLYTRAGQPGLHEYSSPEWLSD